MPRKPDTRAHRKRTRTERPASHRGRSGRYPKRSDGADAVIAPTGAPNGDGADTVIAPTDAAVAVADARTEAALLQVAAADARAEAALLRAAASAAASVQAEARAVAAEAAAGTGRVPPMFSIQHP